MRKYIILLLLSVNCTIIAQVITVSDFKSTTSVEARTQRRFDDNGIACALIKVKCIVDGMKFSEAIGSVVNRTNEYWVYVKDKTKSLTVSYGQTGPYVLVFADFSDIVEVESNITYDLTLIVSKAKQEKAFSSQSVPADFHEKAEGNDPEAQCNLGKCHYLGQGTTQNYYVALTWFRKSAEKDWPEAQYYIGRSYYYGQGFPKPDYKQAVIWLEKASKQDYADAQYLLGLCYEKGQGVLQDFKSARKWYEKAVANGNNKAKQKIQ